MEKGEDKLHDPLVLRHLHVVDLKKESMQLLYVSLSGRFPAPTGAHHVNERVPQKFTKHHMRQRTSIQRIYYCMIVEKARQRRSNKAKTKLREGCGNCFHAFLFSTMISIF